MEKQRIVHEISLSSILKILAVALALYVLYMVKDVIVILMVVFIISIALDPFVRKLAEQGVPKGLSVIVLYLALLVLLSLFMYFIVPPVVTQLKEFALNIPYSTGKISQLDLTDTTSTINQIINTLSSKASTITTGLLSTVVSVFGGAVSAVTVFVLTYYTVVDADSISTLLTRLIPVEGRDKLVTTLKRVSEKLGDWFQGQLSLMLIIGLVDGIALWALGIEFSLTLGIISGLLEIVPVIGPIVSGVAVVVVALITGAPIWKILIAILIYVVVQQVENNILVPKIMQRAVGLSPIVVILAILIGNKLFGIGGAILAVPIAAGVQVFIEEYSTVFKRSAK